MESKGKGLTRRESLKLIGTAGGVLLTGFPLKVGAQEPIRLGTLCPLTGAGGPYGPQMQQAIVAVVKEINDGGGIHGLPIQLFNEDSQTNPEAAVRATHKLLEVNKVSAVIGTWAARDPDAVPSASHARDVPVLTVHGLSKLAALPQLKLAWICASGPDGTVEELLANRWRAMSSTD